MADIGASNWNEADASNSTAAPDGWPEGMAPSGVNDSGRAMMGAVKRWYDWTIPLVTGGTSTAYTLAYSVAPGALVDGMTHLLRFHTVNGATATLNVNALGAKPLYCYAGSWVQAPSGMFSTDRIVRVTYNASAGAYFVMGEDYRSVQSFTAGSSVSFQTIPTTVNTLQVLFDVTMGTNAQNLLMQFYNSAGTLDTGATAYFYVENQGTTIPSAGGGGATAGAILLATGANNSASTGISGDLIINNIQGAKSTQCNWRSSWLDQGAATYFCEVGGGGRIANGNITGIKIFPSAGTFSGLITLRASVN